MKNLTYLILIFFIISCKENTIYNNDRQWTYVISSSLNSDVDTIVMDVKTGWLNNKMNWELKSLDSSGNLKKEFHATADFDEFANIVLIRPLSLDVLAKTVLMPYPQVRFPINIGDKNTGPFTKIKTYKYESYYFNKPSESEVGINDSNIEDKIDFPDFEFTGYIKVIDKIYDEYLADSVWVLESRSNSDEFGELKAIYHFSEYMGFTKFMYDFIDYKAQVKLIDYKRK